MPHALLLACNREAPALPWKTHRWRHCTAARRMVSRTARRRQLATSFTACAPLIFRCTAVSARVLDLPRNPRAAAQTPAPAPAPAPTPARTHPCSSKSTPRALAAVTFPSTGVSRDQLSLFGRCPCLARTARPWVQPLWLHGVCPCSSPRKSKLPVRWGDGHGAHRSGCRGSRGRPARP